MHVPHTTSTKSQITSQLAALVMRAIEVQPSPPYKPLNLQIHTSVNEAVEMPICVFQTQCVGVGEKATNKEMQLCWERHQRHFLSV
jgi:hypothetical protein